MLVNASFHLGDLERPTRASSPLALVTTTSRREVEWLTVDVGRIFPEAWERFNQPSFRRNLALAVSVL